MHVQAGDIFGYHFPTSPAPFPHPGLVIKVLDGPDRARILAARKKLDLPAFDLCYVLMISHRYPRRGEYGEHVPMEFRAGTKLDHSQDIYACYRHFDFAFLPASASTIKSVNDPYMGRMSSAGVAHFRSQLISVQDFSAGRSFQRPQGVFNA